MKKNDGKISNYNFYVSQLVFDFMHDEYIITIVCCNLMNTYNFWGKSNAYIILSDVYGIMEKESMKRMVGRYPTINYM